MSRLTHKYLRFMVLGVVYQFLFLPFSLAIAPREFTTMVKELRRIALRVLVIVFQYIDDWVNRADSHNQCAESTQKLIKVTQLLGWMINVQKSELNQTYFLGLHV